MTKYILEVIFLILKIDLEPLGMEIWNPSKKRGFKFPSFKEDLKP